MIFYPVHERAQNTIEVLNALKSIKPGKMTFNLIVNSLTQHRGSTAGLPNTVMVNSGLASMGKSLGLLCCKLLVRLRRSQ